ncbi:DUF4344 domain-containing metallopeptidase [Agarivorans sp. 1_MG-2023]|uniref:DUF4344 domain-containing metallopeptidase n=1 Tax=Agarivorans sp. 1_MG-2023 TaxID=3062634 RepID=UPI0026E16A8E|nr:DUF4344 domain-containing metallopeptidase [Agarivorans sp. 1_MG-2023]MDO6765178.1 DUF4344 domain-containing metallopeptidase [Agarivorans sp. 1_MG-2023]
MTFSRLLFVLACLAFSQSVSATPAPITDKVVSIVLDQPAAQEQASYELIKHSEVNQQFERLLEQHFPFEHAVTLQYGSSDGPLYDPEQHTIFIPYSFVSESLQFFTNNDYAEQQGVSAEKAALDTLLHTLLHEAAHAYIADQQIPILGKEEDAADNLATLMLLNYVEHGDDIAISAADMFAFESDEKPRYYEMSEYIAEHSFDLQRYFSTLCLVYGSDPERHKQLLDEIEKDYQAERKEFCIYQFEQSNYAWHYYLAQP